MGQTDGIAGNRLTSDKPHFIDKKERLVGKRYDLIGMGWDGMELLRQFPACRSLLRRQPTAWTQVRGTPTSRNKIEFTIILTATSLHQSPHCAMPSYPCFAAPSRRAFLRCIPDADSSTYDTCCCSSHAASDRVLLDLPSPASP